MREAGLAASEDMSVLPGFIGRGTEALTGNILIYNPHLTLINHYLLGTFNSVVYTLGIRNKRNYELWEAAVEKAREAASQILDPRERNEHIAKAVLKEVAFRYLK